MAAYRLIVPLVMKTNITDRMERIALHVITPGVGATNPAESGDLKLIYFYCLHLEVIDAT